MGAAMTVSRRSRAALRILSGFLLLGLIVILISLRRFGIPDVFIAVGSILLGTFGILFYFQGCLALARAKGYDDTMVLGGIIFGALCTPGFIFILPLILAFFLKDKTRPGWSRSKR
jgi:hypothetical protein